MGRRKVQEDMKPDGLKLETGEVEGAFVLCENGAGYPSRIEGDRHGRWTGDEKFRGFVCL